MLVSRNAGGLVFAPWSRAQVHVEWGVVGARHAADRGDVVVIVDVVLPPASEAAQRGERVLFRSTNGAAATSAATAAPEVLIGSLRNARACAAHLGQLLATTALLAGSPPTSPTVDWSCPRRRMPPPAAGQEVTCSRPVWQPTH